MKALFRFLGLVLAAGAFVSFVIDGARSIATDAIQTTPTGAIWAWISLPSLNTFQAAVERHVSPLVWDPIVLSILTAPFFAVLLVLAILFLFAGRRPRPTIGHAIHS
ncbi:MAG: hypothetical protein ACK50Q_02205 [Labrys sp. (in: a-proteobacteria)]|jgi:hypothetical protein